MPNRERIVLRPKTTVIDPVKAGPSLIELIQKPFADKHAALGGAPGLALAPVAFPEVSGAGQRVRYQNGSLFMRPDGDVRWVYGAIAERYDQLGAGASWLGLPLSDEQDMSEGGRGNQFEHGAIYWWPDVGAIDINEVVVHYTGLMCFRETDRDGIASDADEPYVLLGSTTRAMGDVTTRTPVYEGVDSGESLPEVLELYRGKPEGIALSVMVMENDFGDPDLYKDAIESALAGAATALTAAVKATPVGFLAVPLAPVLAQIVPILSRAINDALGTGDDRVGLAVTHLTAKDMVVLAARTTNSVEHGIGFKAHSPLFIGEGDAAGAKYEVYFGLVAV